MFPILSTPGDIFTKSGTTWSFGIAEGGDGGGIFTTTKIVTSLRTGLHYLGWSSILPAGPAGIERTQDSLVGLGAGRSDVRIPTRIRDCFSSSERPLLVCYPHSLMFSGYRCPFLDEAVVSA